jgi:glucose-6-phosphate 1-epimerase
MVHLCNAAGDSAVVSVFGAQVLSWCTASGGEQLYCSQQTKVANGRAIRGGIPICFPQFANCGPLIKHGFARISKWQLLYEPITVVDEASTNARFLLENSADTLALWPHHFALELLVTLGAGYINLSLRVSNTGDKNFVFTAALHTYIAVVDISQTKVCGLARLAYLDSMDSNIKKKQGDAPLEIAGELDRIYLGATEPLALIQNGRTSLHIVQQNFADAVVWNPGPLKASALGDMPASDWVRMLCIEAAQVEHAVNLEPGRSWHGQQRLSE